MVNFSKYHLYIETVQSNVLRILFDNMKDFVNDANFIFDKSGIHSMTLEDSKVLMICLDLDASKFNTFYCPEKIRIGLNVTIIQKLLKIINNNNTVLRFYIDKNDPETFKIYIGESEKETSTVFEVKLLSLNEKIYEFPDVHYSSVMIMSSSNLLQKVKLMSNFSKSITFETDEKGMYISSSDNEMTGQKTFFGQSTNQEDVQDDIKGIYYSEYSNNVKNTFSIKYVLNVTKNASLCNNMFVYLEKGSIPLILEYFVGSLGKIKYCIAPKIIDE